MLALLMVLSYAAPGHVYRTIDFRDAGTEDRDRRSSYHLLRPFVAFQAAAKDSRNGGMNAR